MRAGYVAENPPKVRTYGTNVSRGTRSNRGGRVRSVPCGCFRSNPGEQLNWRTARPERVGQPSRCGGPS